MEAKEELQKRAVELYMCFHGLKEADNTIPFFIEDDCWIKLARKTFGYEKNALLEITKEETLKSTIEYVYEGLC